MSWIPPGEDEIRDAIKNLPLMDVMHTNATTLLEQRVNPIPLAGLEFVEGRAIKAVMMVPILREERRITPNRARNLFLKYWKPFINMWVRDLGGYVVPESTFKKWGEDGLEMLLRTRMAEYVSPNRLRLTSDKIDLETLLVGAFAIALDRDERPLTFSPKVHIDKAEITIKPGIKGKEIIKSLKERCEILHIYRGSDYFIETHEKVIRHHGQHGTGSIYVEDEIDWYDKSHFRSIDRFYRSIEDLPDIWPRDALRFIATHGIATKKLLEFLYPHEESKIYRLTFFRQHHVGIGGRRCICAFGLPQNPIYISPDIRFRVELCSLLKRSRPEDVGVSEILFSCEFPLNELTCIIDEVTEILKQEGRLNERTAALLIGDIKDAIDDLFHEGRIHPLIFDPVRRAVFHALRKLNIINNMGEAERNARDRIEALHRLFSYLTFEDIMR